jgi:hypothetical protein
MFNSFRQRIDIVFTKDGILTLTMLSLFIQRKQIYFSNFAQFKDSLPLMQFKRKKRSYHN